MDAASEPILQVRQLMPRHGEPAALTVRLTVETPDSSIPIDVQARFAWFSSPLKPGEILGASGGARWFTEPGLREANVDASGNRIEVPTGAVAEAYRTTGNAASGPGGGYLEIKHAFNQTFDRRQAVDMGPDDPLYYNLLLATTTAEPERLDLNLSVSWTGGPAWLNVGPADAVRTWSPSDMTSTASAAAASINFGIESQLAVDFEPTGMGTLVLFFPPVRLMQDDHEHHPGTAYVQPPGEKRRYLDEGRLVDLSWIDQSGVWRFGQDRMLQLDRWDQASIIALDVADLSGAPPLKST